MKLSLPLKGIGTLPGVYCTQRFGERPEVYSQFGLQGHNGLDWACPVGTPIYAPHDGIVSYETETENYGKGYGQNARLLFTDDGIQYELIFAHLSRYGTPGQVKERDIIGWSGDTGFSTGPHLHFGIRPRPIWDNGYFGWVNPIPYLKIQIRFLGWNDKEKGVYIPFDTMDRMQQVFGAIPALTDYQFEQGPEYNMGKRKWGNPC